MNRWLLDTSAYARRRPPAVSRAFAQRLTAGEELLLPAPTLLELLRTPRGGEVAALRDELADTFELVGFTDNTAQLAAYAMVDLAERDADSHRLPVADLLNAALAVENQCGVLHLDRHYERAARTLGFEAEWVCDPAEIKNREDSPAERQRSLRRELYTVLSRLPMDRAERLLAEFSDRARAVAGERS
ncbi:MAG: hypothetical protein ACLP0J_20145 [Solirubrobacteraceae bacterium]